MTALLDALTFPPVAVPSFINSASRILCTFYFLHYSEIFVILFESIMNASLYSQHAVLEQLLGV